ncbi:MAG: U-box protein 4-like [Gammaproteobacteria bacterium]|jgi:HEAT repeat protein|nr:U-box protein 4-like [Gammaproteobacteria bacterium]
MSGHNEIMPQVYRSYQPASDLIPLSISDLLAFLSSEEEAVQLDAVTQLLLKAQTEEGRNAIGLAGGIPRLISLLASGSMILREKTMVVLSQLTVNSHLNQIALREAGGIPLLVAFLSPVHSDLMREHAAEVLANLTHHSDSRAAIRTAGGIPSLMALLENENPFIKNPAARALYNLGTSSMPVLIAMLKIEDPRLQCKALNKLTIHLLTQSEESRVALLEPEAIAQLVALLGHHDQDVQRGSAEVLEYLILGRSAFAIFSDDAQDIIRKAGAIPKLLPLLGSSNIKVQLVALKVLCNLDSSNNCTAIRLAGAITPLVALLKANNHELVNEALLILINLCQSGANNAIEVLAAGALQEAERLMRLPEVYFIDQSCRMLIHAMTEVLPEKLIAASRTSAALTAQAVFLAAREDMRKGSEMASAFFLW